MALTDNLVAYYKAFDGNPLPSTTTAGKWVEFILTRISATEVLTSSSVLA